jgi:hypothetical protein
MKTLPYLKPYRLIGWVFTLVLFSLVISAVFNLQLFQDGSSYLFEILVSHSAIRHDRITVLPIQAPAIFVELLLAKLKIDPVNSLRITRLVFNLSYSLIPFISLTLSWIVVRGKNEGLFVWPALIILFVNLVNFSWVSELLISMQLLCPLLLVSISMPGTRAFWILLVALLPVILFLHPLVLPLFVVMALGCAYVAYKEARNRRVCEIAALIYLAAAIMRGVLSLYRLSPYEVGFLESNEMRDYLVMTSPENMLFLIMSVFTGATCLSARFMIKDRRVSLVLLLVSVIVQASCVVWLFVNLKFIVTAGVFVVLIVCAGITVTFRDGYWKHILSDRIILIYISCMTLTVISACLLLSQYFTGERSFPLKTGLTLFVSALIMIMTSVDSARAIAHYEHIQRFRLVMTFAIVFSLVNVSKSLIWHSSVQMLERSISETSYSCIEVSSGNFTWLQRNPYNIIDNWALPTLALMVQDVQHPKLLLQKDDCKYFYETDIIQIDPWSKIPQRSILYLLR